MKSNIKITQEIAECVGLWLAEGDSKTKGEITFTNNCFPLIKFFSKTILQIFKDYHLNPRLYIYSPDENKVKVPLKNIQINYYRDRRATKPYFLFRVASVKIVKEWIDLVKEITRKKIFFTSILRGFFAGEGNIKKTNSHNQRVIRIAQKKPNELVEKILNYHCVEYHFSYHERAYVISGIWNWERLASINLAELHPIKNEKFWKVYNGYIEKHYPNNHIRDNILQLLTKPYTSLELAQMFNRSHARLQEILILLKDEGTLERYKIYSDAYWIRTDQKKILISRIKQNYLFSLKKRKKKISDLAKEFNVCWKSAYRRLNELLKLQLVKQDNNGFWECVPTLKEVIVL
jgi:predicted transcriptional regulator